MLSTIILSKPKGPRELFTMFEMDCAAMTGEDHGSLAQKLLPCTPLTILITDILARNTISPKKGASSGITLEHCVDSSREWEEKCSRVEIRLIGKRIGNAFTRIQSALQSLLISNHATTKLSPVHLAHTTMRASVVASIRKILIQET